jgi:hypothetical protein
MRTGKSRKLANTPINEIRIRYSMSTLLIRISRYHVIYGDQKKIKHAYKRDQDKDQVCLQVRSR